MKISHTKTLRGIKKDKFLYFALFFVIFASSISLANADKPDLQKGRTELQGLRTEIREKKKGLAAAGRKEKNLLSDIERIDRRLNDLEAEERRMDREIIVLEKGLQEKTSAISVLSIEIECKKRLLYNRLVFIYKFDNIDYMRFLLSSGSLTDGARKYRYMTRIAAHDSELIRNYERDAANLSLQMDAISADKEKLEGTGKELVKKRAEIKKEREKRDRLLISVRKEKFIYKNSLKELEANARNLQRLLEKLERQASMTSNREKIKGYPAGGFEQQKGLLDFPVAGKVAGFFGKEIDKTSQTPVYRKGIEIKTNAGAAVRAVYKGRVIFADRFKGYELMIIIDHGGGYYTIYAHASKLLKKMNDEIDKGDIIAEIGDNGSIIEPLLYFEVRKGGKPENPLDWLKP